MTTRASVVKRLNRLLDLDRDLTENLVDVRHLVSEAYTNAEEFAYMADDPDYPCAGLIGVLNGLLDDGPLIAANYDEDNKLIGFMLLEKK